MKTCTKCGCCLPHDSFGKRARSKDGLQPYCKSCNASQHRAWYDQNAAQQVEANRNWRSSNREKFRQYAKKRSVPLANIPPWADRKAMNALYAEANQRRASGESCVVDHIVPLVSDVVSGLHTHTNLQIVSTSANSSKGNWRWPDMP